MRLSLGNDSETHRMHEDDTTQRLAAQAQSGDKEATEALARRTYPGLLDAARGLLRRRAPGLRTRLDSADLAQSAYRDAIRALPRYEARDAGSFRGWLRGVLLNKIRRRLTHFLAARREIRREVPLGAEAADPNAETSPLGVLLSDESRQLLERSMASLSPRQQLVLRFRFFEALPWAEAAARLETSEAGAQMLCHRALEQLRDRFVAAGGEE